MVNATLVNGTDTAETLTAWLSWPAIRSGLGWPCDLNETCVSGKESLMFEALLVSVTLAAATWGGWVFSRFYFTDGTSQVHAPRALFLA